MRGIIFFLSFLFNLCALSYEGMIVKGYTSCLTCHYNPQGGGFLTKYGQVVSDSLSLVKGTRQIKDNLKEIQHGFQGRVAHLRTDFGNETFPMQADYMAAFSPNKNKYLFNLARAPKRSAHLADQEKPSFVETLYFRELKYLRQIGEEYIFEIGREKQNLGFRLEDHTLFSKSLNKLNITDLTTLVGINKVTSSYSFHGGLFLPSFQEAENNKESGGKLGGNLFFEKLTLGLHGLYGETKLIKRKMALLNFKYALGFFLIMAEGSLTSRTNEQGISFDQVDQFIRLSLFPIDEVELFLGGEKTKRDAPFSLNEERLHFGTRIKILANLSLRNDWKSSIKGPKNKVFISQLSFNWW